MRVDSICYYCCKRLGGLIPPELGPRGDLSALTEAQRVYVGVIDPYETGQTFFDDFWALSPIQAWERMVGIGEAGHERRGEPHG